MNEHIFAKSAWKSKINAAVVLGTIAQFLAYWFGIELDAKTQAAILVLIPIVQNVFIWVLRTWFNNSVSPDMAGKTVTIRKA